MSIPAKKIAIVGSGVSGLGALWALKSTNHEVHLYEAEDRYGGHTNTVAFRKGDESTFVDTGFIVLNTATYPNFIAFLKELGVETVRTEMTFGVSRDYGLFEWAGTSLSSLFAQKENLTNPSMWRMIFDIIRFNQYALDLLREDEDLQWDSPLKRANGKLETIGEYLDREGYSESFRNDYLIPMTAAVWSTSPDKCSLEFPAVTLVRFMWNHHLLNTVAARPDWLTVKGGAKNYIGAVLRAFPPSRLNLSTPIRSIENTPEGQVALTTAAGNLETFDHVILATSGDQALKITSKSATPLEKEILSAFKTSNNTAVLHSDLSLMPTREAAWSAWNYLTLTNAPSASRTVSLTYWMNLLQHVPTSTFGPCLVTLNPLHSPRLELTQGTWEYAHPLYTATAIRAQRRLDGIQNTRGISYAGAWTGYGFHEDGLTSGLRCAVEHLGAKVPWGEVVDARYVRGKRPELGWQDWFVRGFVWVVQVLIFLAVSIMGKEKVQKVTKKIE